MDLVNYKSSQGNKKACGSRDINLLLNLHAGVLAHSLV